MSSYKRRTPVSNPNQLTPFRVTGSPSTPYRVPFSTEMYPGPVCRRELCAVLCLSLGVAFEAIGRSLGRSRMQALPSRLMLLGVNACRILLSACNLTCYRANRP